VAERELDPEASIQELLRRAEHKELIASAEAVERTTVYRALVRRGVEADVTPLLELRSR
jgi:hypothetical protein